MTRIKREKVIKVERPSEISDLFLTLAPQNILLFWFLDLELPTFLSETNVGSFSSNLGVILRLPLDSVPRKNYVIYSLNLLSKTATA